MVIPLIEAVAGASAVGIVFQHTIKDIRHRKADSNNNNKSRTLTPEVIISLIYHISIPIVYTASTAVILRYISVILSSELHNRGAISIDYYYRAHII